MAGVSEEVYHILNCYYVGADNGDTKFAYSINFLKWWINSKPNSITIGLRIKKSDDLSDEHKKLVEKFKDNELIGYISGVPQEFMYNGKKLMSQQVDFLVVHPELRSQKLAPLLIQEITRRSYK